MTFLLEPQWGSGTAFLNPCSAFSLLVMLLVAFGVVAFCVFRVGGHAVI